MWKRAFILRFPMAHIVNQINTQKERHARRILIDPVPTHLQGQFSIDFQTHWDILGLAWQSAPNPVRLDMHLNRYAYILISEMSPQSLLNILENLIVIQEIQLFSSFLDLSLIVEWPQHSKNMPITLPLGCKLQGRQSNSKKMSEMPCNLLLFVFYFDEIKQNLF